MRKVLIVEDDPAVALGLNDFVRTLDYEPFVARDGEQAIKLFDSIMPDLVLLDLVLPGVGGEHVCRYIRRQTHATPVIMITAKGQIRDRIDGLDLGADDYVTKPFDLAELAARIRAVMRRVESNGSAVSLAYQLGDVRIDLEAYTVERRGQRHRLSARERDILALLLTRQGQVVTRNDILNAVWGLDKYPSTRTVDNYIVSLRKKLEADPSEPTLLLSVRSAGYKLAATGSRPQP